MWHGPRWVRRRQRGPSSMAAGSSPMSGLPGGCARGTRAGGRKGVVVRPTLTLVRRYWPVNDLAEISLPTSPMRAGEQPALAPFGTPGQPAAAMSEGRSATSFERARIGPSPATRASAWAARSVWGPNSTIRGGSDPVPDACQAESWSAQSGRRSAQSTNSRWTDDGVGRPAGSSTRRKSRSARAAASAMRLPKIRSRPIRTTVTPTEADLTGRAAGPPVARDPGRAARADARPGTGSDPWRRWPTPPR